MLVGVDTFSIRELELDPFEQLDWLHEHDFSGAQFGGLGSDSGRLKEIRAHADALGLYSYVSVFSPNRHLGDFSRDDVVARITREIRAAADAGWHELHSSLGSERNRYRHPSVSWEQQLTDSVDILATLRPVLTDCGSRINLEPHFDTTTFELVRICEEVGPEVCGVCLDTANVLLFGEHPVRAAERVAPYVHQTHIKDAFLFFDDAGLKRQTAAPGRGDIDLRGVLAALGAYAPDLPISIEDHKWIFSAEIFEPWWHAEQRDLTREELASTVALAWNGQQSILSSERMEPERYEAIPYLDELEERLHFGRDHLRSIIAELGF